MQTPIEKFVEDLIDQNSTQGSGLFNWSQRNLKEEDREQTKTKQ